MPALSKPRVVVVGGSFAGLATARHLKKDAVDVVLIEPRDFFEYTPGAVHLLSGSNATAALLSPMEKVCQGFKHERGWFAGLAETSSVEAQSSSSRKSLMIRRSDGTEEAMSYDALVICTGVPYSAPIRASSSALSYQDRILELEAFHRSLDLCDNIVIEGGGLVGVELAAEFAVRLRHKPKITLISRSSLLNTLPDRAGALALKWMHGNRVEVIVGDCIKETNSVSEKSVTTQKGVRIPCTLYVDCTGRTATPSFSDLTTPYATALAATATTASSQKPPTRSSDDDSKASIWPFSSDGLIVVDEHLQAVRFPHQGIFAAGDVVEHQDGVGFAVTTSKGGALGTLSRRPAVRNAHLAESQAELCAANVRRFLKMQQAATTSSSSSAAAQAYHLLSYPGDVFGAPLNPLLACVSLGPRNAILCVNGFVLGGAMLGIVAALAKFVVERSKVAEIRQQPLGRAFWALSHVAVNALHSAFVFAVNFVTRSRRIFSPEIQPSTI